MKVRPRADLDKDLLIPYRPLRIGHGRRWGVEPKYIPQDAYPLKLIHQDDDGYVILLMDEKDDNSTIIASSIDFDFLLDYETEPNTDFFEDLERLLTKHFVDDWTWHYKDSYGTLYVYSESMAQKWEESLKDGDEEEEEEFYED